jgi:hypothetical protein
MKQARLGRVDVARIAFGAHYLVSTTNYISGLFPADLLKRSEPERCASAGGGNGSSPVPLRYQHGNGAWPADVTCRWPPRAQLATAGPVEGFVLSRNVPGTVPP